MKLCKILVVLFAVVLLASPAWSGNVPEFDAVGCDSLNYFAVANLVQHVPVIENNLFPPGRLNDWSDFTKDFYEPYNDYREKFAATAGQEFPDPCFPGYLSVLTATWNMAYYDWWIVLQMKPESDINLNIYDCVLKHNEQDIFYYAEQTGRYRADFGQLMFLPASNPEVSAWAYPGPHAFPPAWAPFNMSARPLPGLFPIVPLDNALYTSKAHWEEGIVMVMPETGGFDLSPDSNPTFYLHQGDQIRVRVTINRNPADIRYGRDSVILKYIGIYGTWHYGDFCAFPDNQI